MQQTIVKLIALSYRHCSTCFGHHNAHHQEPVKLPLQPLVSVWMWRWKCSQPWSDHGWEHFHLHIHTETRGCDGSLTGSWWWALWCPKYVEQFFISFPTWYNFIFFFIFYIYNFSLHVSDRLVHHQENQVLVLVLDWVTQSNTNSHARHINDWGNGARGCMCNWTLDSPDDGPAGSKHVQKNCKCKKIKK